MNLQLKDTSEFLNKRFHDKMSCITVVPFLQLLKYDTTEVFYDNETDMLIVYCDVYKSVCYIPFSQFTKYKLISEAFTVSVFSENTKVSVLLSELNSFSKNLVMSLRSCKTGNADVLMQQDLGEANVNMIANHLRYLVGSAYNQIFENAIQERLKLNDMYATVQQDKVTSYLNNVRLKEYYNIAYICNVETLQCYRKQGYAENLIRYIVNKNDAEGCVSVLDVDIMNEPALRLYKKIGFEIVGSIYLVQAKEFYQHFGGY